MSGFRRWLPAGTGLILLVAAAPLAADAIATRRATQPDDERSLQELWDDLASEDAARASRGAHELAAHGATAAAFIRRQVEPLLRPDPERVKRLLVDLDDDSWFVRERASAELSALGGAVVPALREALERNPSAEVQWRIEVLLAACDERLPAAPAARRLIHAVAVLDRIDAAQPGQARPLIEQLARTPSWAQPAAVLTLSLSAQARRDAPGLVSRFSCGDASERLAVLLELVVREADGRAERTRLRHNWPASDYEALFQAALAKVASDFPDPKSRLALLGVLEVITREHRLKGVAPALLAFLSDPDRTVRLPTLRVLGAMDGKDAAPVIAHFLDDPDKTVRRDALHVLVEWRSLLAKPVLIGDLSSPDDTLRLEALRDLPKLGAVEAIPQIEEHLEDPGASHRLMALSALFQMDARQSGRVIFERCVEGHTDPNVTACALALLVKWDDQRAIPSVMARLSDRGFADRNTMVNRLIEFEAAGIVPALIEALDTGVGRNADADQTMMRLLSHFDPDQAVPVLRRIVRETRDTPAWTAAQQLGRLQARSAIGELFDLVQRGAGHWEAAVEALARLNDPAAAERVIAELPRKSHRDTHAKALDALAALSDPATCRILEATKVPVAAKASIEDYVSTVAAHTGIAVALGASIPQERRRMLLLARTGETELTALEMLARVTHWLGFGGPPSACFIEGGKVEILPLAEVYAAWERWLARDREATVKGSAALSAARLAELTAGLRSAQASARAAAVKALGATRDPRAVAPLLPLLHDTEPAVREAAEAALLWVRHLRDLDALAAAAKAEDCRVQLGAIEALGRINDARCLGPLAAAFASSDVTVCEQAAWALSRLPKGLGAEPLRTRLEDVDCRVRFAAAVGLMCCEGGASIDSLLARMKDRLWPCPNRRCLMLHALDPAPSPVQIRMLLVLLTDDAYCIRSAAAYALRNCRDPVVIDPLIDVLKGDPHDRCRSTAGMALRSFNEPRVVRAFLGALTDAEAMVRVAAAQGLGRCKDPQAEEPLLAALEDPSPGVRESASYAVANIKTPAAVGALLRRLADTHPTVREAADKTISRYTDLWAVPLYVDALAHTDARVRAKAQEMLRTISGQDFGQDRDRWTQWWREQTSGANPKPEPAK